MHGPHGVRINYRNICGHAVKGHLLRFVICSIGYYPNETIKDLGLLMDLRRRLKRIEKELHIGRRPKPHVLVLFSAKSSPSSKKKRALPKNVQEWVLFQRQIAKCPKTPFVFLPAWSEVEAREKLQKTAKSETQGIRPNTKIGDQVNEKYEQKT